MVPSTLAGAPQSAADSMPDRQVSLPLDAAASMGIACVTVDAAGLVERMNPEAEALLGRRALRCIGRPLAVLHDSIRETTLPGRISAALERRVSCECRDTVAMLGSELVVQVVPTDPDGAALFYRVEHPGPRPGSTDHRLRQIVDAMSDIVSITAPDGTLRYLNQAGRDLLGIGGESGPHVGGLFPTHTAAARELLLTEAVPAAIRYGRWTGDTALQAADGRVFPATQTILAHRDEDGEVSSLSTIIRDVSVERHTSIALRESQRLFEVIARSTPDLLYLVDPIEQRIVWTNRCPQAFLGGPDSESRGFSLADVQQRCHPDDVPSFVAHLDRLRLALGDGDVFANEIRMRGEDGNWHWLFMRDSVFTRDERGNPLLILGVATDITDQKASESRLRAAHEAADAANRAKSEFLARMSHELRTPLNSVIGFSSQLLRNRSAAFSAREITFIERVRANGMHLLETVSDILDHTAIESGDMPMHQRLVDLRHVVADAERYARGRIGTSALEFTVSVPAHPVPWVTDPGRVQKVLHHLLSNAVKFTPTDGQITLALLADADGAPRRIVVTDSGVGIPVHRQSRIFEAFEQVEGSYARRHDGTGLGLAVARGISELLGCRLSLVRSAPGEGTTFELEFPQPTRASALALSLESRVAAAAGAQRVLIADDNPEARRIQSAMLSGAGYEVRTAASGVEALRLARSWRPDVIALDLVMPAMDGREVLAELKADVTLRHIPVLVVTVMAPTLVNAPGCVAILAKPVERDRLLTAVASALAVSNDR